MVDVAKDIPNTFRNLDPDATPLGWYGGVANQALKQFYEAIPFYEQAIMAHPNHVKSMNNLGLCYLETGNYDNAISNFNKAINILPSYLEATVNLSSTYYRMGDYGKAWETIVRIPEHRRDDRLQRFMKNITQKEGLINNTQYNIRSPEFTGNSLKKYVHNIYNNKPWYEKIKLKALETNTNVESVIYLDAQYLAFNKEHDNYLAWNGVEYFTEKIKANHDWLELVKTNATENNRDIDEEIILNANYVFKKNHPGLHKEYHLIREFLLAINNDDKWLSAIASYANKNNIEPEVMKDAYAGFLAESTINGLSSYEKKIDRQVKIIQSKPEWLDRVKQDAKQQQKPIDEILRKEAIYIVERRKGGD